MNAERYGYLMFSQEPTHLTADEIAEGWHFCGEWDGLLIHKDWPEAESCGHHAAPGASPEIRKQEGK